MPNKADEAPELLAEYQACSHHVATLDSAVWQSASILLGASFATLGLLSLREATTPFSAGTSAAAFGAVVVIALWERIWLRHTTSLDNLHVRMREIEWQLNMRKNIYLNLLSHWDRRCDSQDWNNLAQEEQDALKTRYKPLPWPGARHVLMWTGVLAQAGWLALAIGKWIELWLLK